MKRRFRGGFRPLAVFCLLIGFSSQAFAQASEIEPNGPCVEAQDLGEIDLTGPFSVEGSLDTPPGDPDVASFRFSAPSGAELIAEHEGQETGAGTLPAPFLGLFDTGCNSLQSNADAVNLKPAGAGHAPKRYIVGLQFRHSGAVCDLRFLCSREG